MCHPKLEWGETSRLSPGSSLGHEGEVATVGGVLGGVGGDFAKGGGLIPAQNYSHKSMRVSLLRNTEKMNARKIALGDQDIDIRHPGIVFTFGDQLVFAWFQARELKRTITG